MATYPLFSGGSSGGSGGNCGGGGGGGGGGVIGEGSLTGASAPGGRGITDSYIGSLRPFSTDSFPFGITPFVISGGVVSDDGKCEFEVDLL